MMSLFRIYVMVILGTVFCAGITSGREQFPEQAKKHFSFAIQNKKAGNYEEAERQMQKSLSFCDTIYNVHYSYGDLLLKMDRPVEAICSFRKALALNSGHYDSAAILAKLYYESADYDSALVMYRCMNEMKPEDTRVLASIAGLSEYLGHADEAFESYVRLIEIGKGSHNNLIRAARLALNRKDLAAARTYAVRAHEMEPGDTDALTIAAEASSLLHDKKAAAGYYRILVESDSSSVRTVEVLENLYRDLSDRASLIWALERHHELVPEDVEVIGELSELLYAEDKMDKAIVYVRKGLDIDPDDGRFHILLGENYRSLGQDDKARAEFSLALKDPRWKSSAQQLIWQIEKPESAEQKAEREFFNRGRENGDE